MMNFIYLLFFLKNFLKTFLYNINTCNMHAKNYSINELKLIAQFKKKKKVELELELKIFKLILFQENGHH